MSQSDLIILSVAAYVAVMTLVRLMKTRRDILVADVQKQVNARRRKKPTAADKRGAA